MGYQAYMTSPQRWEEDNRSSAKKIKKHVVMVLSNAAWQQEGPGLKCWTFCIDFACSFHLSVLSGYEAFFLQVKDMNKIVSYSKLPLEVTVCACPLFPAMDWWVIQGLPASHFMTARDDGWMNEWACERPSCIAMSWTPMNSSNQERPDS